MTDLSFDAADITAAIQKILKVLTLQLNLGL